MRARTHLYRAQRFLDGVGDRLHLPLVQPRAQDEVVGERRRVPEIENDDVDAASCRARRVRPPSRRRRSRLRPPEPGGRFSVLFSAVFFSGAFFSDRLSVFIADVRRLGFYAQTVSQDVGLDRRRHEAADALAGAQPPADICRRYVRRARLHRKNRRPGRNGA